jgi:multiple sugar transport system permease protein
LVAFSLYPLVYGLALSFSKSQLGNPFQAWIGVENYRDALADGVFVDSLKRSIFFSLPVSLVQVAAALAVAIMLDANLRAGKVIRTLILLPLITPPIMVAATWKLIFNPTGGLLNNLLRDLGVIEAPVSFLGSSQWALPAVALADTWQWTPFAALLAFAALQGLPSDVLDAAAIDGASAWRRFWSVMLPTLLPALAAIFLVKVVISFKIFDLVYAMTGGGPGFDTNLASFQIYRVGLQQFNVGYAAAQTMIFGLVVGLVTLPIVIARDKMVARWM